MPAVCVCTVGLGARSCRVARARCAGEALPAAGPGAAGILWPAQGMGDTTSCPLALLGVSCERNSPQLSSHVCLQLALLLDVSQAPPWRYNGS